MIRDLMEAQMSLLWADLSRSEIDAEEFARRAETLFHYATCLRDFPELPEILESRLPDPPECFEGYVAETPLDSGG